MTASRLDSAKEKIKNLRSLIEVSALLNLIPDLDDLLSAALETEKKVMRAEAGSIMLLDESRETLLFSVALGEAGDRMKEIRVKKGQGIAGWVAEQGKPLLVPDVSKDPRFDSSFDKRSGFQTRSILCVPLRVKDDILGVAQVINHSDGQPFNEDDVALMEGFANILSVAIENARLQGMRLAKQKMEQELSFAENIQQSFLPDKMPDSPRFRVFACNQSARSVGGDLYDFKVWDDEEIGVVLGDVSGKGVPAALYMARFISDFQFLAGSMGRTDPTRLFFELNELLAKRSNRGMFVTVAYAVYNALTHKLRITNGGHMPPLHYVQKENKIHRLFTRQGIPMGMIPGRTFDTITVPFEKGDMLLLYTDGITEARNPGGDEYQISLLEEDFTNEVSGPEETVNHILGRVLDFMKDAPQHDDMTLVALQALS